MAGFQDFLKNNNMALMQAGAGLLGGRTANEQAAMGLQGFASARQDQQKRNMTMDFLQRTDPELAQAVASGVVDPQSAFMEAYKRRLEAQKPKSPLEVNGRLVDPTTFQVLADFSTPKEAKDDRTANMKELEAAGLIPGTPEYQQALLKINAPKGMMIESDGAGGFRMVQGADVSGGANLNVEQGKNTGFLLRAQDANQQITKFEEQGTSAWNKTMRALPAGVGNYGLSAEAQQLEQAKRDFINAVLRQESGAVISPEEFANAEQQYFPQPGDSEQVIEQKRRNRENAISGFRIRSGPGAGVVDQMRGPRKTSSGVTWSVD